jgi:branched-chain amino acid transport system ATP-binding protein
MYPPAVPSRCSVPTAPARRPCCARSAACWAITAVRSSAATSAWTAGPRAAWTPPRSSPGGIAQALEGRRVFGDLTVAQNLRLGAFALGDRAREARLRDDVLALFPILGERLDQRAGLLSGGEQQMLAIGRALMAGPRLLILDEPSLGLAPIVAAEIAEALLRIRRQGTAILLADQSTALALRATEQAFLLENGRVRASGPTSQLLLDDELRACYLGTAGGRDVVLEEVGG